MAILVALGGAALGYATGLGASAGWAVGSVLGSLLFPGGSDTTVEGPRLGDLTVTSATYGTPIPIAYGTVRMAGTLIWSSGIREERTVHKARAGKGGGPTQTTISYAYYASFALAFGEGPGADVLRLWADGKLIFDKTGANPDVAAPSLRFRFHGGSEDQLPDPLIEAAVGAGKAPAHRGLVTIVFEDLALAAYGNRLPNLTAEIAYAPADTFPYQVADLITSAEGGAFASYQVSELAVDWSRGSAWFVESDGDPAKAGLRRLDLRTMREDRQVRMSAVTAVTPNNFPDALFCGSDGFLYLICSSGNSSPLLRLDPDAVREVARFGFASTGLSNTTTRFVTTVWMGMVSAFGAAGRVDFLLTGSAFNDIGLLKAEGMTYVWGAGMSVDESRVRGVVGGRCGEGYGEGWVLASGWLTGHTALALYRITVAATAMYDAAAGATLGVTWDKVAVLSPSDIEAGATAFYSMAGALCYDPTDDSVVFQIQLGTDGAPGTICTVKWRADLGVVWSTAVPIRINYDGPFTGQARLTGSRWTLIRGDRVIQLDTATGALVSDRTWPYPVSERGAQVYDAVTDTLLVTTQPGWLRLFLNRGGGQDAALAAIVADLCGRAGLGLADVDTAALTDTVPGYVIARQSTVRSLLEPLAAAFFFDGIESDDRLVFRPRGRPPVAALTWDDLVQRDDQRQDVWTERRTQEVELPAPGSASFISTAPPTSRPAPRPPNGPFGRCRRWPRRARPNSTCRWCSTPIRPSGSPRRRCIPPGSNAALLRPRWRGAGWFSIRPMSST